MAKRKGRIMKTGEPICKCPMCHKNTSPSKTPKWKKNISYFCPKCQDFYRIGSNEEGS